MLGQPAPAFSLPDQNGTLHTLADYRGQWVVLYGYPRDMTHGCTAQACGFRDTSADFAAHNAVVLGISSLGPDSKKRFADQHRLTFPLLADEDHSVSRAYGLWAGIRLLGRDLGFVRRQTFLIDPQGTIAMHWPHARGSASHADEVLAWLKQHAS